jgi:glycyl-tRNA synthetase beta chain
MPDFLLEVGCEEIPARMIDSATAELARRVGDVLVRERLSDKPAVEPFSTPRRLAVIARGISAGQPDVDEQVLGPSLKVAFKDGAPTPAAQKFAEKVNLPLNKLEKVTTAKGEYLAANLKRKGRTAGEILAEALPKEVASLYWAKTMYWRGKGFERWVRPVHWMVALLDSQLVPLEWAGVRAGKESRGHRLLANRSVPVSSAAAYPAEVAEAKVLNYPERERQVRKALDAATRAIPGARWREDPPLLNKVVNLTEFPSVILGNFDPDFLSLPAEVLVTVMRDHQNYFALEDASGKLAPHFLATLNREGDPTGIIRHGHERVLRARFNDARFFWNADQKLPLKQRVELLKKVTFQKDLGSYYDKTQRVMMLATAIAEGGKISGFRSSLEAIRTAAELAKADLTTELVKEFTELQGVIGGLYAGVQGLGEEVATAIYDHYKPQSMEDDVPRSLEGAVVSIADKADTISGMFARDLIPTGSKDPFALRRQANGIIKTMVEHRIHMTTSELFRLAWIGYTKVGVGQEAGTHTAGYRLTFAPQASSKYTSAIESFFRERLEFYLKDVRRYAYDAVNAVLAADSDEATDAVARAEAIEKIREYPDFQSVCAAFTRIKGILRQARERKLLIRNAFVYDDTATHEEKSLAAHAESTKHIMEARRVQRDYVDALTYFSTLRPHIDAFFDKVLVMVDDDNIRSNRLALLENLLNEFTTIADFSEIVTEKK